MISKIKLWLKKRIAPHVHYFNGSLYQFKVSDVGDTTLEPCELKTIKFLIVSPSYVASEQQSYPVVNKKELKSIIALKASQYDYYQINRITKDGADVDKYTFSSLIPKAWCTLPEIILLESVTSEKYVLNVETVPNTEYFYLTKLAGKLRYSPKVGLINSIERFQAAVGISTDKEIVLSWDKKAKDIFPNITYKLMTHLALFRQRHIEVSAPTLLLKAVLPVSFVALVYMSLVSAGLLWQQYSFTNQVSAQSPSVSDALILQSKVEAKSQLYKSLTDFVEQRQSIDSLWEVMAPFFDTLNIDSISLKGERISFRAESESATATLEQFSASSLVYDAKFDTPISTMRGGERFTISFILKSVERTNGGHGL